MRKEKVWMIDFHNDILTFIGCGNRILKPREGFIVRFNRRKYETNENLFAASTTFDLRKLCTYNILANILDEEDIEIVKNVEYNHQNNNPGKEAITRKLHITKEAFEERLQIFLYEFTSDLDLPNNDVFSWFVGEMSEGVVEAYGYRFYDSNTSEGDMAGQKPSSIRNNKINTDGKEYSGTIFQCKPCELGHVLFTRTGYHFYGLNQTGKFAFGSYGMDGKSRTTARWDESFRVGVGLEEYGEGVVYYGYTSKQKKNGMGLIMLSNGMVVFGNWTDNFVNGPTLSLSHIGTYLNGVTVRQVFSGYGEMFYRNYSFYKGYWDGGQYHGKGTIYQQYPHEQFTFRNYIWDHGRNVSDRPGNQPNQSSQSGNQSNQPRQNNNPSQTVEGNTFQTLGL